MRNTKFINAVIETSKTTTPAMPWARGARRAAFVQKRADMAQNDIKRAA